MDSRIIYTRDKKLWRGRECSHPGCESFAATQCEGWVGSPFYGNVCAEPLCEFHRHRVQNVDYCDQHRLTPSAEVRPVCPVQQSIFDCA